MSSVMSNIGLEIAMERMGGKMLRTGVGDGYAVECMRKRGYSFGGEQSDNHEKMQETAYRTCLNFGEFFPGSKKRSNVLSNFD